MDLMDISNVRVTQEHSTLQALTFTPPTFKPKDLPEYNSSMLPIIGNVLNKQQRKNSFYKGMVMIHPMEHQNSHQTHPLVSTTTDVGSQYGSTFDGFGSFATSTYMVPPKGNTTERNRGRAIIGGV